MGVPQPALNINMDAHTNVEALNFSFDNESANLPIVFVQNPETKVPIPIPVPDISPLNPPPGLIPPIPKRLMFIDETSKLLDPARIMIGLAKASKSTDAVTGNGSLNVLRYGRLLKARRLVGVRGRRPGLRWLVLCEKRDTQHQTGRVQTELQPGPQWLVSTLPRVPVMSAIQAILRQVSRHSDQQP